MADLKKLIFNKENKITLGKIVDFINNDVFNNNLAKINSIFEEIVLPKITIINKRLNKFESDVNIILPEITQKVSLINNKVDNFIENHSCAEDFETVFDLIYYADEADSTPENPNGTNSRVLGMNPRTMRLENEIKVRPYSHLGSCDRSGTSDKMLVRSGTTHYPNERYIGVIDLITGKYIKSIPLNYKPRTSGAFNEFLNVHVITTNENPWFHVIDAGNYEVIFKSGKDGGSPHGNNGGNATGHATWLDSSHFAFPDRYNTNIEIWRVDITNTGYTFTKTQDIPTGTGCHSVHKKSHDLDSSDNVFYAGIEGEIGTGITPEIRRYVFDKVTGIATQTHIFKANQAVGAHLGDEDGIHHYGIGNYNLEKIVVMPLLVSSKIFILDAKDLSLRYDLMPPTGYYTAANGNAVVAGHADFCNNNGLNTVAITNHKGNVVSVIDLNEKILTDIPIPSLSNYTNNTAFSQSHTNHIIGTNYYFFEAVNGIFYEIDLVKKIITRSVKTGGKPVQSYS